MPVDVLTSQQGAELEVSQMIGRLITMVLQRGLIRNMLLVFLPILTSHYSTYGIKIQMDVEVAVRGNRNQVGVKRLSN